MALDPAEPAQLLAELKQLAREQAAMRRVAALVAQAASAEEIFSAVAEEVAQLAEGDIARVLRYEPDGSATVVGGWGEAGEHLTIGMRLRLEGEGVAVSVRRTGQPARTARFAGPPGSVAGAFQRAGMRTGGGSPIVVEGQLWGLVIAARTRPAELAPAAAVRIPGVTELLATAIGNAQARGELRRVADEQAALRRVATLVARAATPAAVFAAVAEEVGNVLPAADFAMVSRYDPDGAAEVVGAWSRADAPQILGMRTALGGRNAYTLVYQHNAPARVDHLTEDESAGTVRARALGVRSSAGAPISVEGRLWGVMIVASRHQDALPAGMEHQLAGFTELIATAIANTQARVELRDYADEQAALRRVATLVARAAPPEEVFAAVTTEVGRVLGADFTGMSRYDRDGTAMAVGVWTRTGVPPTVAVGDRLNLGGQNVTTRVFQTGRPARVEDYGGASGIFADAARSWGFRSAVGVPIRAVGRLWGVVSVGFAREAALPARAEARLAGFTELVATAIANAEARAELRASRARIVATADETRRRIERDLHDGAQQRLVSLALRLRMARAALPPGLDDLDAELGRVIAELTSTLDELREYARGIHPVILGTGGLGPALNVLARQALIPVWLDVRAHPRLPERVEVTAYYVVSEALANAVKYACATAVHVAVEAAGGVVRLSVSDDGVGGADLARGSGLVGLKDRVEALGGSFTVHSPPGQGTRLHAELPAGGGKPPGSGQ